ncbi:hypothetical protein INS49_006079 [Diaporthe citri]|uniref:uncharacterized protein n=1 Tax=Diaporthe citri TaxID=83186 RepID=UPI001C8088A0|nr:uncharacterized protein INS49_006079 [Diaporthe citri]KAG6364478.1 hypothetical protein INS49_006079 [Diaporthe citri]
MPEPVYSPSYDSPEPEASRAFWKWNHFEVRTLVCLIIKGEHKISKDPMDLTDKLNRALNPASSGTQPAYSRDVPHAEVQAMLKRILSKKSHAVDLSDRNYSAPVTRAKINAFMRNLDFNGSKDEWEEGRDKVVRVETQKRLVRFMVRKQGGRPSPRLRDERDRRRMLLRDPRAKRLLRGWGIGASFWDDRTNGADHTQATMLDYGSYGGFGSLTDPQQQPYQWTGTEQNRAWGGSGAPAGDQRHPSRSQHAGRGF